MIYFVYSIINKYNTINSILKQLYAKLKCICTLKFDEKFDSKM